jgi:hypothetical protein
MAALNKVNLDLAAADAVRAPLGLLLALNLLIPDKARPVRMQQARRVVMP